MINFLAHVEACVLIKVDAIRDQWFILFTPIYNMGGCERGPFPFVFQGGKLAGFSSVPVWLSPHIFSFEDGNRSLTVSIRNNGVTCPVLCHYAEGGIRAIRAVEPM